MPGPVRQAIPVGRARQLTSALTQQRLAEAKATHARERLASTVATAADDGYSVRAIAEAIGLPPTQVHVLIQEGRG